MAKRRTKEDKKKAREHHEAGVTYSYADTDGVTTGQSRSISSGTLQQQSTGSLYSYDISLIRGDIVKTMLVSLVILSIELMIYYFS